MIRKLHIQNYKSLFDLELEVGRFNVLIGENGCGKSNVLEAITLAGAAAADKLDNEFLGPRGIRVTEPQLMRSAFSDETLQLPIQIEVGFEDLDEKQNYTINHDNQAYAKWTRLNPNTVLTNSNKANDLPLSEFEKLLLVTKGLYAATDNVQDNEARNFLKFLLYSGAFLGAVQILNKPNELDTALEHVQHIVESEEETKKLITHYHKVMDSEDKLKNFLIYSPENTALRKFEEEKQIEPLGINGEGLLKLLKVIQSKSSEKIEEIHASLELFDWYEKMDIPKELSSLEDKVTLTDRYLSQKFDQRSANEGFLFVLFYIALMVSDDTPKIFAIDNIDVALNPKLCTKLITELVRLSKKYDKQVFVTTHNPAILDGIDLGDEEQRLFVVSRNKQGHTRFKRLTLKDKPRSSTDEPIKLSEAFLRGYLGGLPKGF